MHANLSNMDETENKYSVSGSNPTLDSQALTNQDGTAPSIMKRSFPDPKASTETNFSPTSAPSPSMPGPVPFSSPALPPSNTPAGGSPSYNQGYNDTSGLPKDHGINPAFIIILGILTLLTPILLLTFGIDIGLWIKLAILTVVSLITLVYSLKAHSNDSLDSLILLTVIVSAIVFVGTVIFGSTYAYYIYKLHSLENSYKTPTSSSPSYNYSD